MITLTAGEAGAALGLAPLAAPVTGVCIDSRTLRPGELFVALRGERFDGHDFVTAALEAGASGAVVERGRIAGVRSTTTSGTTRGAAAGPLYEVPDTLAALWGLARAVRRRSGVTVFAVTGSVGKTSTKDLLGSMVGQVRRVVATAANQNNEVGVALTLLAIESQTEAVVVEMGMRGRGQIAALAAVAEPDVGVITNIHPVHLELLGTLEGIAQAKAELVHGLGADGVAVIPAGCSVLQPFVADSGRRVVTWGVDVSASSADVSGCAWSREADGTHGISLRWPEGEVEVETPHVCGYHVANVVAAAAACYAAGLSIVECAAGVAATEFNKGRGEIMRLPGLTVIDDTYNANPAAVRAALDALMRVAAETGGRPVAVLGEMLELGLDREEYHRETGAYAAGIGVRVLWGVGSLARHTVEGFEAGWGAGGTGMAAWSAGHVASAAESSLVMANLQRGDVVLFKASRSVRLETMLQRVVEEAVTGRWGDVPARGPGGVEGVKEKRSC